MTKEQIDAIERLYHWRGDRLDARSYSIRELLAAARRALELEEALEYAFSDDVLEISGSRCYPVGYMAHIVTLDDVDHEGEGTTPLEAIQNARRGM